MVIPFTVWVRASTQLGRQVLHKIGLTNLSAQVAAKLGIRQPSYAAWERKTVALRPDQVVALAKILGVSTDSLFGLADTTPKAAGPVGKARKVFEEVSALPRRQQDKIIGVVETLIAGSNKAA